MEDIVKTDPKSGEWQIDAATFDPKPAGKLTLKGVDYPLYSFLDIPTGDSVKVVNLNTELEGMSFEAKWARAIEQILILNKGPLDEDSKPKHDKLLTEEQLRALPLRQLVALSAMATSVAVPTKPDAEGGASPSGESAPEQPAPLAGPTGAS